MIRIVAVTTLVASFAAIGCVDKSPPPPRVAVPQDASEGPLRRSEAQKPMPADLARAEPPPPAFDDVAIIDQEMPERREFVRAYNNVGRPLLIVEGLNQTDIAGTSADRPVALMFSDWLRADGAVNIATARGERAKPDVVIELAVAGEGDREAVNLSARAINVGDNVILGQAMVDMPKPVDRGGINRYTRFLARKLMNDMTRTWQSAPVAPARVEPVAPVEPIAPVAPVEPIPSAKPQAPAAPPAQRSASQPS
jgi:hypothetical protein